MTRNTMTHANGLRIGSGTTWIVAALVAAAFSTAIAPAQAPRGKARATAAGHPAEGKIDYDAYLPLVGSC